MSGWMLFQIGTIGSIIMLVLVLVWLLVGAVREKQAQARERAYMALWRDWGDRTNLRAS